MSKFILVIFTIFVFCFSTVMAQTNQKLSEAGEDILLQDPQLSSLYQRGPFLVYDCISKHWVCTAKPEKNRCNLARSEAIAENDEKLPCATVKAFKDHLECVKFQGFVTNSNMGNRFCMHPTVRRMEFNY